MTVYLYPCLSYPASKAHHFYATLYCIVTCGLSGSTTFFQIISETAKFSENKPSSSSQQLVAPLADPFPSHISRSLFNHIPWFLLYFGM